MSKYVNSSTAGGAFMPASDLADELLTIAEAAKLLKVSTATLHRWLKDRRLRAYHVGPRAVRVHRADLAKLLVPTTAVEDTEHSQVLTVSTDLRVPPLTEAEAAAALIALTESQALTAAIQHQHGKPLSASWPLIRQAREEHATRL